MSSGTQHLSEGQESPLPQKNEQVERVAVLNERRRTALAEIDKAAFSWVLLHPELLLLIHIMLPPRPF